MNFLVTNFLANYLKEVHRKAPLVVDHGCTCIYAGEEKPIKPIFLVSEHLYVHSKTLLPFMVIE